ncbi:MAG: peptidase S41, partial [Nitrospinae bacterium]|nr:peptidase S41 [Nitrospinota bacterium]
MNPIKNFRKYSLGLLAGLLALLCLPQVNILGPIGGIADAGLFNNDLEILEEVVDLVSEKYVYPPDHKKLFSAAI